MATDGSGMVLGVVRCSNQVIVFDVGVRVPFASNEGKSSVCKPSRRILGVVRSWGDELERPLRDDILWRADKEQRNEKSFPK